MSWRVARSLDVLLEEVNAHAPARSKVSDGSIGDAAHATRSSDHNPWVTHGGLGIVRARDFTHDPGAGLDCHDLAFSLAEMILDQAHPALGNGAYVIWSRQIFSAARRSEGWRPYTGSNPHTAHLHLSVALDADGYDSTRRWHIYSDEDDEMNDEDRKLLRAAARDAAAAKEAAADTQRLVVKVLARVNPGGAIRTKLNRLIQQGRATRAELEELAQLTEASDE